MTKTENPREYTLEECRQKVLDHLEAVMRYVLTEDRQPRAEDKLHLMVFCMLTMLDGDSAAMPAFEVRPSSHPDDVEYHMERGENWWPSEVDIFDGEMHSRWARMKPHEGGK